MALAAGALWVRFGWAPGHVDSSAELAANYERMGSEAALMGRFTEAVEFYQRATDLAPDKVDAWILLGCARADADDRAGALTALQHAQRLAPGQPEVDRALGRVYLRFGRYADARRAAEEALQHTPDDPQTLVLLALARAESLASSADETAVEALVRRALSLGYSGPEPRYAQGLVALHRHRPQQAIAAFRAAVQRDPHSRTMRYRLATAYRLAGQPRAAERELEEFRRLTRPAGSASPPPASAP